MPNAALWDDVAAGNLHVLAIDGNNRLFAGGSGVHGRLGLDSLTNHEHFQQVGNESDWVAVSVGTYHSVAIRSDGSLWTWGRNNAGQLGTGNTTDMHVPTHVMGPERVPHPVTIVGGGGTAAASESPALAGTEITLNAGIRPGYRFLTWTPSTPSSLVITNSGSSNAARFIMPNEPVYVTAEWSLLAADGTPLLVTVIGSRLPPGTGINQSGHGVHPVGSAVTVRAGTWHGFVFDGWEVTVGDLNLPANIRNNPNATFTMPATVVTLTATWRPEGQDPEPPPEPGQYRVTVHGSEMPPGTASNQSGQGWYFPDATVNLNAGTRSGYVFNGWQVNSGGVTITNPNNANASFVMPSSNVTVTATWRIVDATNITIASSFGRANVPFQIEGTVWRGSHADRLTPIIWERVSYSSAVPGVTITATVTTGGVVTTSGEGTVRVRGTGGGITRYFNLTFSRGTISATVQGLETLHVGVPVYGRIVFTMTGDHFADEIVPSDFTVNGLPIGLRAEPAIRLNDTTVVIPIVSEPGRVSRPAPDDSYVLHVPESIPARNIRQGMMPVGVTDRDTLVVGPVLDSAAVLPGSIIFDLNPGGEHHRDIPISLHLRTQDLRGIYYGEVRLEENRDFTVVNDFRNNALYSNTFTIRTSFLSRLPVGQWTFDFVMRQGANPVLTVIVIDTTNELPAGLPTPPPIDPGPTPTPPPSAPQADEGFIYLTGGLAVNVYGLDWHLNRARVNPTVLGDRAYWMI
jgi:uncharacterized repeat protein (TIGR02543 family)